MVHLDTNLAVNNTREFVLSDNSKSDDRKSGIMSGMFLNSEIWTNFYFPYSQTELLKPHIMRRQEILHPNEPIKTS